MSTRISSLALLALPLVACSQQRADQPAVAQATGPMIECARGQAAFARTCSVDRTQTSDGLLLTVRHADGAFRRLLVSRDGNSVTAADGAEPAVVRALDADAVEVALGGDRYRLPATITRARDGA